MNIIDKYNEIVAGGKRFSARKFAKENSIGVELVIKTLKDAGIFRQGLNEHRQLLKDFSPDEGQLLVLAKRVSTICGYGTSKMVVANIVPIVRALFLTQDNLPFFWEETDGYLASCWNDPKDWGLTYIKYQVGHINPKDNGGKGELENLCFMCARCNNHIQSSLTMDEVIARNSAKISDRIKLVIEKRQKLFISEGWKKLIVAL